jgi:protein arginine kinase activator
MLCEVCHKRQAVIHITQIIDTEIAELHLCEECAAKKGITGGAMMPHFSIAGLLAGLVGPEPSLPLAEETAGQCSECGQSFNDFKKRGQLGCSNCYRVFRENLVPLLRRIHGSTRHRGKHPLKERVGVEAPADLKEFKDRLKRAIETEDFEEAARLRDRIRDLEEKKVGAPANLKELRDRLKRAIETEDFEEATRLRDRIRDLEEKKKER